MSDFLNLINSRRSIRKYKPDLPARDLVEKIIDAGLHAPSGRKSQPAIIIDVKNKELRDKLSVINCKIGGWPENFDPFYGAPEVLIVLVDKSKPTAIYDGSTVMENLLLAAHSLGLGACWIHRAKQEFESDEGKKILADLGIKGDYEGIGHCILGYADEQPEQYPLAPDRVFVVE